MNKRYDHDGGELYRTCVACGTGYHIEGMDDLYESESGKTICEYCLREHAVKFSLTGPVDYYNGKFYASAEHGGEEFGTKPYPTRKEAKDRVLEVAALLWPGVELVEE